MEGSLYQRGKSKTWYVRFDTGKSPDGKRVQRNIRIGRMSKSDAEVKKRELLRLYDEGALYETATALTTEAFLKSWLHSHEPNVAATTHERYADLIRLHAVPVVGSIKLSKFRPEHGTSIYRRMQERGLSRRTQLHVHRVLHTAFQHAVRVDRFLKENPFALIKPPRPDHRELPKLSDEQIRALVEIARNSRLEVPIALAAMTGLRRGEMLALKWSDVDFDGQLLFVRRAIAQSPKRGVHFKAPKSKGSTREVPLTARIIELLRLHRDAQAQIRERAAYYVDNDLVFCNADGTPWPPNTLTAQFAGMRKIVGLNGFRLHDLRHAFATLLLADGQSWKEVQLLMGHSAPSTTLNVYARGVTGLGREAVRGLEERLFPS